MTTLLDILGQIFIAIWVIVIIYLLIKVWNGFEIGYSQVNNFMAQYNK